MSLQFDHLVQQVQSPEDTKMFLNKHTIQTVNGGQHTMWGTYNTLSYFGLTYIEQIAVYDRALFEEAAKLPYSLHHTFKRNHERFGFSRIALRTTNIEGEAERLRALGFEVYGPDACSRTRPDGSLVEWKLLHFGKPDQALDFPFFIEWADGDEERIAQLEKSGALDTKQSIEMTSVLFVARNVAETVALWQEVLQIPQAIVQEEYTSLQLPNMRLDFYGNSVVIADNEEGPFAVTLKDPTREKQTIMFPHALYYINP
ncbi:hypothetical protein AEA09_10210 [Lysinibacillus contaminans]|uniref:Glyoxalase-like domain-containing protein n=1 Tax=Lysinibacillus contaminans TaxID=1293441 RepID=A0ABR5K2C4_9BACI|nr:VOC family protein [Lysinibacillus contaminans]KOS68877.1 hypothetical protein AEA09_10210 [Lysinibacillus contaminans]